MTSKKKAPLMLCQACREKYPRMAEHPDDTQTREMFRQKGWAEEDICEVHEGDTDPALWGYGTQAQQDEAQRYIRDLEEHIR